MNYKLTTDVCRQLECSPTALANYLARHPEFKPAKRLQTAFFWTDEEIESVKAARAGALRGPVARPMLDAIDYGDILRKMADEPLNGESGRPKNDNDSNQNHYPRGGENVGQPDDEVVWRR